MRNRRQPRTYYAFIDLDFSYMPAEVDYIVAAWKEGKPLDKIHSHIYRKINRDRELDEVFLLAFDLARNGLIEARIGGIFGGQRQENSNAKSD